MDETRISHQITRENLIMCFWKRYIKLKEEGGGGGGLNEPGHLSKIHKNKKDRIPGVTVHW